MFNEMVDFISQNTEWYIDGRSRIMVDSVFSHSNNGLLFTGSNHYRSTKEHLDKLDANYVIVCSDCTEQQILWQEKSSKELFNSFARYKINL